MWQVGLACKLLEQLPIKQMYVDDCEADDLIGGYREEEIEDRMTNRQQALGHHMQQLEIPLYQF